MGMKITAEDIYNINKSSLKDAIVSFGGFCTGEIISSKGLVLTNHHCGFDAIQRHSSLANNYIQDGFWAMTNKDELPNPSLFVTFIVRIEDVTADVLRDVASSMTESSRQSQIDKNISALKSKMKYEEYQSVFFRPFFEGNQYFAFVTETYRDVRLVGAPPSSVGNFGKDTDNWMWPRHTGDFSMFRIYADKNNRPAAYSPDNLPYIPKKSLSISMDGVTKDDFTMVFGFPGRTNEYLPAVAIEQLMEVNNPVKIAIRDNVLKVMDEYMRSDEQIKIQYAAKWASVSNSWKKWQGEMMGLKQVGAVEKKKKQEAEFFKRLNANQELEKTYGWVLNDLQDAYSELKPYGQARDYFTEIASRIELLTIASQLNSLISSYDKDDESKFTEKASQVKERLTGLYANYSPVVDQKLFEVLMEIYVSKQNAQYRSRLITDKLAANNGNYAKLASSIYEESGFGDNDKTFELLGKPPSEAAELIKNNVAVHIYLDMLMVYQTQVQGKLNEIQEKINSFQRLYMAGQMEVFKEKRFYPDANSTLRLTYGKVNGYSPSDSVTYDYYSYLDGVIEKYKPGDYEFDVPEKLRELHKNKDYGPYGIDGKMPVCFIATNHTTGGNSGSPALDAYGNLVGLNFDRAWEGTMSDINYDPSICRNIMVDIRYVLFIVDKYAGAGHLVKEMNLVHPKGKK